MELRDYWALLRRSWPAIVVVAVLGGLGGLGVSALTTPTYAASAQIYVSVATGDSTSDLLQGSSFTRQQVVSYANLVDSPLVLRPVIDDLALDTRVDTLGESIVAESPLNSSLINITVRNESPAIAAAIANAVASEFSTVVSELDRPEGSESSSVKMTTVREAVSPESPATPRTKINAALGVILGAALVVVIGVLRQVLNTRVRNESDIAKVTDIAVVGAIPLDEDAVKRPLILQADPRSPRSEAFRRLRTNVQFLGAGGGPALFAVTSSVPGEGKTSTIVNLGIALADAGQRVMLIDCDLRRPAVARYLGIEGSVGLTTVLIGQATAREVVQPWGNGRLDVLPSGEIPPNPSELLGSPRMQALLRELSSAYDVVLLDTPPLLPVTDAAILSRLVGGVLMVARAGRVHRNELQQALTSLAAVDASVRGVVLNGQSIKDSGAYVYYGYRASDSVPIRAAATPGGQAPRKGTGEWPRVGPPGADSDALGSSGETNPFSDRAPDPVGTFASPHHLRRGSRGK
ncbi:polysaccharide biosynthesis tyrosine autokinase [Cellulomonas sp. Sa3CUA2]|uniref:non-specific protein-tyrosine kinase n=2 Tax=Cellulomonas avistercoris TaxID=2762242 RepID=A0ABR8Q9W6_9CELL|nr:polysaccharide biosynthesis tyrosine autokinase [Cellulomonas avistercoris]